MCSGCRCRTPRACTGCWSTPPPCGRTKWPPGPKKRQPRRPGAWPQPRRVHDQAPPKLRRAGPDLRPGPDRWPGRRLPSGPGPVAGPPAPRPSRAGRPGVRRAGYVRAQIQQAGATAVIPSKKNRTVPIEHNAEIYKERNHIERAINGLKRFRAVATRFDKRANSYYATCCLVAALTWL